LLLEYVEQRRRHWRTKIVFVFTLDLAVDIFDLVLVEEVQRRVEVGHVDDTGRLLRDRRVRRMLDLLRGDLCFRCVVADGRRRVHREILIPISRVREIGFPQHRQQVVFVW
jgi:hypothetical protein